MGHIHQIISLALVMASSSACLDINDRDADISARQATNIQVTKTQSAYHASAIVPLLARTSLEASYWDSISDCEVRGAVPSQNETGFHTLLKNVTPSQKNKHFTNATDVQTKGITKLLEELQRIKNDDGKLDLGVMRGYLTALDLQACRFSYRDRPGYDADFIFFHTQYKGNRPDPNKAHISFVWRLGPMDAPDEGGGQRGAIPLMVQNHHQGTDNIGITAVRFMIHSRALMLLNNAAPKDSLEANQKSICGGKRQMSDVGRNPESLFHYATKAFVDQYPKSVLLNLHGKASSGFAVSNGRLDHDIKGQKKRRAWANDRPASDFVNKLIAEQVNKGLKREERILVCDEDLKGTNPGWHHQLNGDCPYGNVGAIYIHNRDAGKATLQDVKQCKHGADTQDSGRFIYFEMPISWTNHRADLIYKMAEWLSGAVRDFQ